MCKNIIYLCLAVVLSFVVQAQALTVVVDGGTQYQIIEGWGACLYPDTHAESDLYLDQRWRDGFRNAGMNIIRLNVTPIIFLADGGTLEGPEVPLTGDLATDAAKFDFESQYFRYSDDLAAWLSQNALEPSRVKILGGIWSVPHWAKAPTGNYLSNLQWSGGTPVIMYGDLGCSCGGTWDTGIYVEDRYQYCARWLAAFCYGFEQHSGVPLYGLSIQNEVGFEMPFDSCTLYHIAKAQKGTRQNNEVTMDYNVYANALKAVKDNWPAELSNVKLMGPHHAGLDDYPASPWGLLWQTEGVQAVKDHADSTLIDFLDVYTHNYGVVAPAKRAEMFEAHWNGIDAQPDEGWGSEWGGDPYWPPTMHNGVAADGKQIWNSEFGGHDPAWPGPLDLALDMHIQTVRGHESAMVYWQFCSHGNSGGSVHELVSTSELDDCHQSLKYCAFKQFSRYIRPGATRVQATFNESGWPCYGTSYELDDDQSINVSAFVHGADGRVTVVLVNMTTTSHPVDIVLPSSPTVSNCDVYRTSSSDHYVLVGNVPVSGGVVSVTVPAQSVVTVTGVGSTNNPPGQASNPSPADGAGNVSVNADLTWTAGSGADSHDVYFGTTTSPSFATNQTETTYDPGVMANNTTYYWRIDEINAYGTTTGTLWSFTTESEGTPPGQATNPSPADGATEVATTADLSWTAGSGADSHDVYFGTTTTPLFAGNQTETTFEPGTMAESTTYFWRIDEVNSYGTTTGVLWNFTTGAGGCVPTTMHVDSITVTAPMTAPPNSIGRAEVVIVDNCGDPVSGALVSGTFTGDINESGSDTTDDNGLAVIETVGTAKRPSSLTFCVDDVTDTLTYNAGDNVETCDSL